MRLSIPPLGPEIDMIGAAIQYANAGWYVGPARAGTKHPGSVLGKGWHHKTTRDPQQIADWFAGTDHGLFLHVGRSGAVVFDVDNPSRLPEVLLEAIGTCGPPYQATRVDEPGRGHYLFTVPEGRTLGNGVGRLGGAWGEIRGVNGVIIAAPSRHEKAAEGGIYVWRAWGELPVLPEAVAELLDDATPAADAASDRQVAAFLDAHTGDDDPEAFDRLLGTFERDVAAGEGRHGRMVSVCAGAMREAAAGLYPARRAADGLRRAFVAAVSRDGIGPRQGKARHGRQAHAEFDGILAWAVGQALAADPEQTRQRVEATTPETLTLDRSTPAPTPDPPANHASNRSRRVALTPSSAIRPKRVKWLWNGRLALGTLALLAGREGLGKSTVSYQIGADLTRGKLDGEFAGTPKSVLVCATEDSWEHTIVPRLMAAGADLDRVYRVDVYDAHDVMHGLMLPEDIEGVHEAAQSVDAALLVLDPLLSRIASKLDTHKDADVRQALEPLVSLAERAELGVLGLMHHNKSGSSDPLQLVMASKAFTAVARSVHTVIEDPDDEAGRGRLFGTPKNNLGRTDLPTLAFHIEGFTYDTDDGPGSTGRLVWDGERAEGIGDIMAGGDREGRSATAEAVEWLLDYLKAQGGDAAKADVVKAGRAEGFNVDALNRAAVKAKVHRSRGGFPARALWTHPDFVVDKNTTLQIAT